MLFDQVEVHGVVDEAHELHVGRRELGIGFGREGLQHDGQDAGAVFARRLGDELLDPVGQAHDVRAVGDEAEFVAARGARGGSRDGGGEDQRGVARVVDRHLEQGRVGLVEDLRHVDAGEARGHEAERGERRIAAAHVRVGVEHAVARLARRDVERRARIGDDHDVRGGVDAEVGPGRLEGAAHRVGLDRRTRLRRDDQRRLGEAARLGVAVDRGEHLPGGGGIEDRQRQVRRRRDHFGRERRAAHAGEHQARDTALRQFGAQRLDLGHERARHRDGLDPAEATRRLGRCVRAPQVGIARRDAARDERVDEARQRLVDHVFDVARDVDLEAHRALSGALSSAVATVFLRSCHDAMNFATPSSSSTWVTSAMSTPSAASWANTSCASS